MQITKLILEALGYDYGCAMLYFDFPQLYAIQEGIDQQDLYIEPGGRPYGLEECPHVTLLYGFHNNVDVEDVRKIVTKTKYTACTIYKPSLFTSEKYDVLKFEASAKYLAPLNKSLKKLSHTTTFKDYKPHMTIAYVQAGLGDKYVKKFKTMEYDLLPSHVLFSDIYGTEHRIAISVE